MNDYEILGLPYGASLDEVKLAFRKLAHIHHPDKGGDAEKFKPISAAYARLQKIAPATSIVRPAHPQNPYSKNTTYSNNVFTTNADIDQAYMEAFGRVWHYYNNPNNHA